MILAVYRLLWVNQLFRPFQVSTDRVTLLSLLFPYDEHIFYLVMWICF